MTVDNFANVRGDPHACARWLTETGIGAGDGVAVTVVAHDTMLTVFDVRFAAPPQNDLPGYPAEHVRVTVLGTRGILAVPVGGDARTWLHRYQHYSLSELLRLDGTVPVPWEHLVGALCLEYPGDPASLRWHWHQGIAVYLRIVQRHLWTEEYARREGSWPVEDAPHGHRADGRPHPITTPALRSV